MRRVKSAPADLAKMSNNKKTQRTLLCKKLINNIEYKNIEYKNIEYKNIESKNNILSKNNIVYNNKIIVNNINDILFWNFNKKEEKIKKYKYSYNNFKFIKYSINNTINILSDAINESNIFNLEEYSIIYLIGIYFSENILKKDKLCEIFNYILLTFIRYSVMLLIHQQFLNEKVQDKLIYIQEITSNIHLLN